MHKQSARTIDWSTNQYRLPQLQLYFYLPGNCDHLGCKSRSCQLILYHLWKKRRKKQIGNNRRRVEVMVCAEKGLNRRNSSIPPTYSPTKKKIKLPTSLEFLDDHGYRPIIILINPLLQWALQVCGKVQPRNVNGSSFKNMHPSRW